MSKKYSHIKMQPEEYTDSTNRQKNEEDKFVGMDHDAPIIHDDNVPKSEDPIDNQTNAKGCPPCSSNSVQTEDKEDPDSKTKNQSHIDEDKVNASKYALEDGKYSKMWKMIYQHVKSNGSADSENHTTEIRAKEDQSDAAFEKLEITQSDAIKLVQEAVDGILQQHSTTDAIVGSEEKNEEGNKSEKNAFNGYSKWRRAIICTKFVTAMEKMQKLYTEKKKSHYYNTLIPDQEAEIVHLRQCLMDERSNNEVWMLDYALRQVIAKLAPVQQQKEALLIEAFETVGPNTEETTNKSGIVFSAGNEESNGDGDTQIQDIGKDTNDSENNVFLDGKKYSSMWRLIHQHIKSGIPKADAEQNSTETGVRDSDWSSTENENADQDLNSAKTELQQKDAIKLVEEAVNEMLGMQVQSCDDQSTDSEDMTIEEDKAGQELPSVLSKVILCNKFIKAMENMEKSKPKSRRYLPQQSQNHVENVHLRAQRMDDKNCEEWMLDYALQQVIGKLAPTQKMKVSLLVEAFERVNPPTDSTRHQRFNVVA